MLQGLLLVLLENGADMAAERLEIHGFAQTTSYAKRDAPADYRLAA